MNSPPTNSVTLFLVLDAIVKIGIPVVVGYLAWQVKRCQVDLERLRTKCSEYGLKIHELSCACEAAAKGRAHLAEEIKVSRAGLFGKELLDKASAPGGLDGKVD